MKGRSVYDFGDDTAGVMVSADETVSVSGTRSSASLTDRQTTIAISQVLDGVGLHTGAPVRLVFRAAPAGAGIVFRRVDLVSNEKDADRLRKVTVHATANHVGATQLGTTIENKFGASVATIEHVMAAIAGLGLDNLLIEIDGPEVPIMDGSAAPFLEVLRAAGRAELDAPAPRPRLTRAIEIVDGDKVMRAEPADAFEVETTIDFADPAIGRQSVALTLTPETFAGDVADARTFCMKSDIDMMRAAGLARGGSLDNAIVVDAGAIVNEEGLRMADEFAMHKALDLIGDLRLIGAMPAMRVIAERPGHALNTRFARLLLETPGALDWGVAEDETAQADTPARAAV